MKKELMKLVGFMLIACLTISSLAGCSASSGEDNGTTAGSPDSAGTAAGTAAQALDPVTLKIVFPGDEPKGQAEVSDAIAKATEKDVNVKLEYTFVPWDQYGGKLDLYAASGEKFDISWYVPQTFGLYVSKNGLAPLDDALSKYGANIKKHIPDYMLAGAVISGKTYGIPSVIPQGDPYGIIIREDLRLKLNVPEIKTLADFETYLEAIKKNYPDMIPFHPRQPDAVYILDREYGRTTRLFGDHYGPVCISSEDSSLTALSYYETDTFKNICKKVEEWQAKGYLSKDVINIKDDDALFTSGKAGAADSHIFDVMRREEEARKVNPEAKMKLVLLNPEKPKLIVKNAFDMLVVGANSENVDRAVMFIDWTYKTQENYDLWSYGIKDKNFTLEGGKIKYNPDDRYEPINWAWFNVNLIRFGTNDSQENIDALKNWDSSAVVSPFAGFNFIQDNVKNEVAQITTVEQEMVVPMMAGLLNYDINYPKLVQKLKDAGLDTLMKEAQKQLDAFKAAK